jgi:hypothetical protein
MAEGRIACQGLYAEIEPEIRRLFSAEAAAEDQALLRLFPDLAPAPGPEVRP